MKKTLLMAAVALAAGVITSQAQVYSQNVVGYINIPVAAHGYSFIANQLQNGSDASATNNNVNTVLSNGFVSDPNGVNNTVLFYWNGTGYASYAYYLDADALNNFGASAGNGWYDAGGNLVNVAIKQGAGHFLYNPSASALTATLVGTVVQGTNVLTVKQGYNTYSIIAPVSTNIDSAFGGFVGTSDPNGVNNDVYYYYGGGGFTTLQWYTDADALNNFGASAGNGWYDAGGNNQSHNPLYTPKVGQGFFIQHIVAGNEYWTNTFTVQ